MDDQCRVTVELPCEPEEAIRHFVDADRLVRWWPDGADTDPRPGGDYHLWWDGPGWHLRGTYLQVDPARVSFTWRWDHDDTPPRRVDVEAVRDGAGTVLRVDHEAGGADEARSYREGWDHFLGRLNDVVDGE